MGRGRVLRGEWVERRLEIIGMGKYIIGTATTQELGFGRTSSLRALLRHALFNLVCFSILLTRTVRSLTGTSQKAAGGTW